MTSHAADFAASTDRVWLNCAHQGPLPLAAARAAEEAIRWKCEPYELTSERFRAVPERLRQALATLIRADPADIVLANSASYGLHLLARSLPLDAGDNVVVMANDFPSDVLPWLLLESRGVTVTRIVPRGTVVELDDLERHVTSSTRVLCLTWVHSFTGWAIDLDAIGTFCRGRGITFVVNASQALGARPLDVTSAPVDALVCAGWKWLCGPYATGFCWIRSDVRRLLRPAKAYWQSMFTADDLARPLNLALTPGHESRRFDIFAPANFLNYMPWTAAIELLIQKGVSRIAAGDQQLVERIAAGVESAGYRLISPRSGPRRSTLVVFAAATGQQTADAYAALGRARVDAALRSNAIRLSPHLYNDNADVDRALEALGAPFRS